VFSYPSKSLAASSSISSALSSAAFAQVIEPKGLDLSGKVWILVGRGGSSGNEMLGQHSFLMRVMIIGIKIGC